MNASTLIKKTSLFIMAAGVSVAILAAWNHAQAGIQGSKHDLGSAGTSQYGNTAGTTEVCVFCHTPHGADTSAAVPLWNKKLPAAASYQTYATLNTSTFDATQGDIGSVSLACLSCHDGAQAMDSMINAPGSGGYNAAGASAFSLAAMSGTPIPMLGTDLRNDHPISMAYAGGLSGGAVWPTPGAGATVTKTSADFIDRDFNTVTGKTINSNPAWWVDTAGEGGIGGNAGVRDKTDMVLYTRASGTGTSGPTPFVECASCHDPHNASSASAVNPKSVAFLRIKNTSSAVCLACHNK